jgi:nucleoid DNA-binding protein
MRQRFTALERPREGARSVTKKDIVRTISEEAGLTQQQTKKIVQKTFDAIIECLVNEQRIELRNFGVFEVKQRAARRARNPRTGKQVEVPAKYVVTFKPGKEMEARVKELDERALAEAAAKLNLTDWKQAGTPSAAPLKKPEIGSSESA